MPVVCVPGIAIGLVDQQMYTISISASDQSEWGAIIAILVREPTMCEQFEAPVIALDAEHVVHKLTGVINVVNQIRVASPVRASEVKEKIQKALERSADVEASRITVQTEGGRVFLSGKVRAWYERDIAERAAWSAPGVTEVQDHLTIDY